MRTKSTRFTLVSSFIFLLIACAQSLRAEASPLQCHHLPMLFETYLRQHYAMKELSPDLKKHAVERFIKDLDPSRSLLLESDSKSLQLDLSKIFDKMKGDDCSLLKKASDLLISRSEEDLVYVKGILDDKYKLDESIEIIADPDKRGFMKSPEERKELMRKLIHFQIAGYLSTEVPLEKAKTQLVHRYELHIKRLKEREAKGELTNVFAEAFAEALDPHSSYLSQDSLEEFQISMRLSLEGIGATLSNQDGFTVIEDLVPGGAADKLKILKPKDKILAVTQDGGKPVDVTDMNLSDVVKMIRGKKGTKVSLTILRQGAKTENFKAVIVRDKIDIKEQAAKISYQTRTLDGKKMKFGVLELPSFYGSNEGRSSYADVKRLLQEAVKEKVSGIVLDLSKNGGGLLEDAVRISGLFIKKGNVVGTKDSLGRFDALADRDEDVYYSGPLVVLVSRFSASASEILAGALKDYRRALIVGSDHTFGKGTVQVLQNLPAQLGAMKVTTSMFFLPGGFSTQHRGVGSDLQFPAFYSATEVGEKTMDYSLPPQKIDTFLSKDANDEVGSKHWREINEPLVKKLTEQSNARIAVNKKFAELQKEFEENQKNHDKIRIAEMMKKDKKDHLKDKTKKERMKKIKDLEAPLLDEAVNVVSDFAMAS